MSRMQEYMDKARATCLWCRGSGFVDHDGLYRCDQCFETATLMEAVAAKLGEENDCWYCSEHFMTLGNVFCRECGQMLKEEEDLYRFLEKRRREENEVK